MRISGRILVIIILCATGVLLAVWFSNWRKSSDTNLALKNRQLATRYLASYLAEKESDRRALVFSNPFTQEKGRPKEVYAFENAGLEGLEEGFRNQIPMKVVFPSLKEEALNDPASVPIDPETDTPLSFLVEPTSIWDLTLQHANHQLLVSLIGLPVGITETELWKNPGNRKWALLLPDFRPVLGNRENIRMAFHSGRIEAAVLNKPGASLEPTEVPLTEKRAFEQKFILVTRDSVDQWLEIYPSAFQ